MSRYLRLSKLGCKPQRPGYLPISQATVWRLLKTDNAFPKPFTLTPGVKVVDLDDVDAWVAIKRKEAGHEA